MKTTCKVIKIGGGILNDELALNQFLKIFSEIKSPKILIHGGGNLSTQMSKDLGQKVTLIDGRRVTSAESLKVSTMVYAGWINKDICAKLCSFGLSPLGLSGPDANIILAEKRPAKPIDYGFAGDIVKVNGPMLHAFMQNKLSPVLCSITHDGKGQLLNTNADTIAAAVAQELSNIYEVDLLYCFEKPGVLLNVDKNDSLIKVLDPLKYKELTKSKAINTGMLPKLQNGYSALKNGAWRVRIGDVNCMEHDSSGTTLSLSS